MSRGKEFRAMSSNIQTIPNRGKITNSFRKILGSNSIMMTTCRDGDHEEATEELFLQDADDERHRQAQ